MRVLLDTHVLIWWLENASISKSARAFIQDASAEIFVSAVSAYEIAFKVSLGKLPSCVALAGAFENFLDEEGFAPLNVTIDHALAAARLPLHHRDPWDRILVAQALAEGMVLISNETPFDAYGVKRVW